MLFKFWFFNGFVCVDMVLDICLYLVWVLIVIIEGLEKVVWILIFVYGVILLVGSVFIFVEVGRNFICMVFFCVFVFVFIFDEFFCIKIFFGVFCVGILEEDGFCNGVMVFVEFVFGFVFFCLVSVVVIFLCVVFCDGIIFLNVVFFCMFCKSMNL